MVIILGAVALLVPEMIHPKFENLVAILTGLGLAIGCAFKDYVSSLAAGLVAVYERPYRLATGFKLTTPMEKSRRSRPGQFEW